MAKSKKSAVALTVAMVSFFLHGCGGGNSDTTSSGLDPGDAIPVGSSTNANLNFADITVGGSSFSNASKDVYLWPKTYMADGNYAGELSGKGIWIGIVDDFESPIDAVFTFPAFSRTKRTKTTTTGSSTATSTSTASNTSTATTTSCSMNYQWSTTFAHGNLVAQIAGGKGGFPNGNVNVQLSVSPNTVNPACASTFYPDTTALAAQLSVQSTAGVAYGAEIQKYHAVLDAKATGTGALNQVMGSLKNALNTTAIGVVNMSFHFGVGTGSSTGTGTSTAQNVVNEAKATYMTTPPANVNAVISITAGNISAPCDQDTLYGCSLLAVALSTLDATKNSTIVVGALTGSGKDQRIAQYSSFPGFLKNNFLWASGDADAYPSKADGPRAQGTSFAAPRVAGAAALLRQQCPALTSAEVASLLLDSADRDMNNDGVPDFIGANPTWGRGKLSVSNALALAVQKYPSLCKGAA